MTGQKYPKKDYENLKKMSLTSIIKMVDEEKKQVKFEEDDLYSNVIKIEKKTRAKKTKQQIKE